MSDFLETPLTALHVAPMYSGQSLLLREPLLPGESLASFDPDTRLSLCIAAMFTARWQNKA